MYFGDLEGVLAAAARALRPNGLLVFTLEHAIGGEADVDYHLQLHGRYSHAVVYVERLPSCGCSRRSPTPNCAWSQARRSQDW